MRQKKCDFRCVGCGASVSLPYPSCQTCKRPMIADGDKFFDHISIQQLRRSNIYDQAEDRRYYVFRLVIGGFTIYGMTYNASKRSVMFPGSGGNRFITAPGMAIRRLQAMLDKQIAELEGESEQFVDSPIAA